MARIGVGVFIVSQVGISNEYKFLLGMRGPDCRSGQGCYALPGGFCNEGERIELAAIREIKEEVGIDIHLSPEVWGISTSVLAITDQRPQHNVLTFWILAHPIVPISYHSPIKGKEWRKCEEWKWVTLKEYSELFDLNIVIHSNQKFWGNPRLFKNFLEKAKGKA